MNYEIVECPHCGGAGRIPDEMDNLLTIATLGLSRLVLGSSTDTCPRCKGKGKLRRRIDPEALEDY